MKDERLVSRMEGKANFSRCLKQFDGLIRLILTQRRWKLELILECGLGKARPEGPGAGDRVLREGTATKGFTGAL